jgi:NitT/TauT family transport system substrate-binding protein
MKQIFGKIVSKLFAPSSGSSRATGLILMLMVVALPVAFGQQLDRVRLAIGYIPNVQFTPLYVGMAKGYYRDAGIDLKIEYGFGMDIYSLLLAGKIDIGLADSDQLIIAGSKRMSLAAVFQYYQNYPVAIVAKKSVVPTPADFAGKTIGVPEEFGTSYIGLQLFLHKYGLEGKVKIQRIGYTQIPALLSNKVDGAVVFVTNETVKLKQLGVPINEWDVKSFSDLVSSSFISSQAIIAQRGPVLDRFFNATRKAMAYTAAHPDEAVGIAMKYITGANESQKPYLKDALLSTIALYTSPAGYGTLDVPRYVDSVATMVQLGLIPQKFNPDRIIHQLGEGR